VRVTNFGGNPQSNFPISYQVGNQAPVTETFTDTLAPLQTATKAFTTAWAPPDPGPYQITARTNLNGDGDATNDSAQTTVQAVRAQYRGAWQGTTGQGLMIRFNVDEQDRVVNLEVDYRISFPGTGSCVYRLCGSTAPISNGQVQTGLGCGGLGFVSGESPVLRGTFSSTTAVAGNISDFRVGFATCGGSVIFGSLSVSGSTFSAQRQVLCPTASGINPTGGTVGANVTITGTNLTDVTAVKFANNVTANFTINSDTQITARVPAGAATGPITISKAGCADVQTAAFTVQPSPTPTLTSLNPASATAGGAAFTLTVNGTNFINGSAARWNGADRTTTFVSNTQLTAAIPATDIAAAGAASVTVFNPAPGGGVSNAMSFTVNAALA
ncbi:MAG: IPT/TIG domain-containing protein, partial [Blastocatellia bacterium]